MTSHDPKDLRERVFVARLLLAWGEDPDAWSLVSGDRPDVVVRSPLGEVVGIEVTELLLPEHGKDRNYDLVASAIHRDVVQEWIEGHGGTGAAVHGTINSLPTHARQVEPVRGAFVAHLEEHGAPLLVDGGQLWEGFQHQFGHVAHVHRLDGAGFTLWEEGGGLLGHKADMPLAELETLIEERVREKAMKGAEYDRRHPLWLLLRNRYQPIHRLSDTLLAEVETLGADVFQRVLLLNDQEDHLALGRRTFPGVLDLVRPRRRHAGSG